MGELASAEKNGETLHHYTKKSNRFNILPRKVRVEPKSTRKK